MNAGALVMLGTVAYVCILSILVHLPVVFAYGFVTVEKVCGTNHIAYFGFNDGEEFYYINFDSVQKEIFCERLMLLVSTGCLIQPEFKRTCCGLSRPSDDSSFEPTGELLPTDTEKYTVKPNDASRNSEQQEEVEDCEPSVLPKGITIAGPGFFFLYCCFLCPCLLLKIKILRLLFWSNIQVQWIQFPMWIQALKGRAPSSPLRVPQSPRFSMSPNLSRHGSIELDYDHIASATHHLL